jgi:hypothetical protein
VREQHLAGLGQRERPRPAGAFDQPLADEPFEDGDLVADRGLDVPEPRRGAAERPFARDRFERGEVSELDSEPVVAGQLSAPSWGGVASRPRRCLR